MIRNPLATLATSALLALCLGLLGACAGRPAGPVGPAMPHVQPARPGELVVPLQLPRLGERSPQFAYQNGYINTLEVLVVDSLGRHQAFLVCRNPEAAGMPGGKVDLIFQDVAPGTAWVTVRTTFKPFIGKGLRLEPVSTSSFALDGGATQVLPVKGDLGKSVLVFKSSDLGGTATAPSVLAFYQNNNGSSELNDTTSVSAGYGVGAATGSVVPGNTSTVSITVAQPPSFGSSVLKTTRQVDAGGAVSILADNVRPGDRVVVVRAGDPAATSDFLDLTKTDGYDYYPLTDNLDGTVTFNPTRATDGAAVQYYLARGEMVSLIGGSGSDVDLAKVQVHPAAVSQSNSSVRIGSDDGTSPYGRRANETDTVRITLKDAYGNLITDSDFGARAMEGYTWHAAVEPNTVALNNGTNPVALVPGATLGTVTTPSYDAGTGTWVATFAQGATAPTTRGASASFALAATDSIEAASFLYDPSNVGDTVYTLGVEDYPGVARRLALSLYRGGAVDGAKFVASASYIPAAAAPAAGATISIGLNPVPITAPTGLPMILRVATQANSDLTTADHGTRITPTLGARTANDTDRAVFRIYRLNPGDGSLTARGVLASGYYTWKQ